MKSKSSRFRLLGFCVPAVAVFAIAGLVLAACGGGGDDEPEATTTTTTEAPPPVAPLTGLPDPGGEASTRPALWVKVGNDSPYPGDPGSRPQTGIELADVVYEEVIEGGSTRFAAVYNSVVPERIGPVRSVRPMDVDLAQQLLGIFAYSGGAPGPMSMINSVEGLLTVDETAAAGEAMTRSSDRRAPHNLYVVGPAMFARGGEPRPPQALFVYRDIDDEPTDESTDDEETSDDGESTDEAETTGDEVQPELVDSFTVGFAREPVTWRWDAASAGWLRFLGDTPFTTIEGTQVSATNVIVQFIHYPNDSEGITVGEGQAWVFTGGEVIRGTWHRDDARSPIRYLDAGGEDIRLTPGRTWVQLLPNAGTVDVIPAAPAVATP